MKILFQGDSITDCGRRYDDSRPNFELGHGYVTMIAGQLAAAKPGTLCYNRAVSGNRICDMYARWIEDTLNIDYDILSILNGINDIGFEIRMGQGADREKFKFVYDRLLYEAMEKHPDAKLVIIEPFIIKKFLGEDGGDIYNDWDLWHGEMLCRAAICRELAEKYNAHFVPLADEFAELCEKYGADVWSDDCIHPTVAGHAVIARKWLEVCKDIIK